jgi:ketosteroid isomerase-like protein
MQSREETVAAKSAQPVEVKERLKGRSLIRCVWLAAIGVTVGVGAILLSGGHCPAKGDSGAHEDIRQFIESYFRVWSAGDMKAYASHFDPSARIALVADGRVLEALDRDPFVAQQAENMAASPVPMKEHMTSFTVEADETAAHVTAGWELHKGPETSTGVDRFTLIRDPQGQWKIVYLVFYARNGR